MNIPETYDLPGATDYADDSQLLNYLARMDSDERTRELSCELEY